MQLVFIQTTILVLPHSDTITKDNNFDWSCGYLNGFAATKNDENIERHKIFKMVIKNFPRPCWRPFI